MRKTHRDSARESNIATRALIRCPNPILFLSVFGSSSTRAASPLGECETSGGHSSGLKGISSTYFICHAIRIFCFANSSCVFKRLQDAICSMMMLSMMDQYDDHHQTNPYFPRFPAIALCVQLELPSSPNRDRSAGFRTLNV